MSNRIQTKLGAVALSVVLGCMAFPSCVIRIGPGIGDEEPAATGDPAGGTSGTGGQGGAGGTVPGPDEVQAAIDAFDALKNVDPQQVVIKSAAAAYATVTTASLVESQIADPSTIDEATINQLFDQYAPIAGDQALLWMESVDPSVLPEAIYPNFTCMSEPYACPYTEICLNTDPPSVCIVTQCGKGGCPWCPFLSNLIYKSWCAYGCMRGTEYVGYAVKIRTIFDNWDGPYCRSFK